MCEEKEGVMRNAMTTRAPGGAKNMTFPNYKFGKVQYAFYPIKLSRFAQNK